MKFILLEGLEEGNRFITVNNPDKSDDQKCRLVDGTLAYKIIGYANSVKDAQIKLYGRTFK